MMTRRPFLGRLLTVLVTGLVAGALSGPSTARAGGTDVAENARAFIRDAAQTAIERLTVADISTEERRDRFKVLMHEYFAVKTIGRVVLGRYWRKATKAEREEYHGLFERLIVHVFADRFARYPNASMELGRVDVRSERDLLVYTFLRANEASQPVDVAWRLGIAKDGRFKIVDVLVEGLSMSITQQKEFASVIRKNGGEIRALLDSLKQRLDSDAGV